MANKPAPFRKELMMIAIGFGCLLIWYGIETLNNPDQWTASTFIVSLGFFTFGLWLLGSVAPTQCGRAVGEFERARALGKEGVVRDPAHDD